MREELIFYSGDGSKIIFDVESTGLDSESNYIAQLSYMIVGSEEDVAKNFFFTVPKMDLGAENIHGLSKAKLEKLSRGKQFKDFADEILNDFKRCNLCIGHNVDFDLKFLKKEFERLGIKINYLQEKIYCTMHKYTDILKLKPHRYDKYKWPKLSEVVNYLNIDEVKLLDYTKKIYSVPDSEAFNGYHDSRFDVISTYMIYIAKESNDEKSNNILYYMESSNKNESIKKSTSNIFKDLFSFKGEIDSKRYTKCIWFLIILRIITTSVIKLYEESSIEFESFLILVFISSIGFIISFFSIVPLSIKRLRTKQESLWKILCLFIPIGWLIFVLSLCNKTTEEKSLDVHKEKNKKINISKVTILGLIVICIVAFKVFHDNNYDNNIEENKYKGITDEYIIDIVKNYEEDGLTIEEKIKQTVEEEISYGWHVEQIYDNTFFVYYEYDNDDFSDNGTRIICYEYFNIDKEVNPVIGKLKEFYTESGHLLKNSELMLGDLPAYGNL